MCQNQRRCKLRSPSLTFTRVWRKATGLGKASDTCQKFGEAKGVPMLLPSLHFYSFSARSARLFALARSPAGSLPQGNQLNARKRLPFSFSLPFLSSLLFKGQLQLHPRRCQGGETPSSSPQSKQPSNLLRHHTHAQTRRGTRAAAAEKKGTGTTEGHGSARSGAAGSSGSTEGEGATRPLAPPAAPPPRHALASFPPSAAAVNGSTTAAGGRT